MFRKKDDEAFLIGFISEGSTFKSLVIAQADLTMCVATDKFDVIREEVKLKEEPKNIVQFFHLEGHGSILYWDSEKHEFVFYFD